MRTATQAKTASGTRAPQVHKIDPPSWWIRHTLNPVRLLIRGADLRGARLSAPGLRFGRAKASANGRWLFVDARVAPGAKPGVRSLAVETAGGRCEGPFELLAPSPAKARPAGFSADDVLYLVMPDRFANGDPSNDELPDAPGLHDRKKPRSFHGGDLQGVIDRLPYLTELGVTALWLTPLYANTKRLHPPTFWSRDPFTDYHGYGAVDYYAVDPHFGDLAKLRELVQKARAAGIKVILDQVNNHTGPHHPWAEDPPTPSWYHGTVDRRLDNPFQTWVIADPYASAELKAPMMEGWFGGMLPDLNQDDPELARYMIQNIVWWAGISGADGLRHDVAGCVPRAFWRDCFKALRRQFPTIRVVGEVNGDLPATVSTYQRGRPFEGADAGFDSLFDFPLRKAMRSVFLEGRPMDELAATLSQDALYGDPMRLVNCFGLHDDSRFMGHPKAALPALKLAFAFTLTTRGIPLVYYGDEIAMRGGDDPDNRRDFPGGWPEDERSAFKAEGRTAEEGEVFDFVRRLISLRRRIPALRRGRLVNLAVAPRLYAYARLDRSEAAIVVLNDADAAEDVEVPVRSLKLEAAELADRLGPARAKVENGVLRTRLEGKSAALFVRSARL